MTLSARTCDSRPSLGGHDWRVSEPEEPIDDVYVDLSVVVGVWANSTRVQRGRDEFTVDVRRHVPNPSRRLLVARALLSPAVAFELRDQLEGALRSYTEWSMPKEPDDGA